MSIIGDRRSEEKAGIIYPAASQDKRLSVEKASPDAIEMVTGDAMPQLI